MLFIPLTSPSVETSTLVPILRPRGKHARTPKKSQNSSEDKQASTPQDTIRALKSSKRLGKSSLFVSRWSVTDWHSCPSSLQY